MAYVVSLERVGQSHRVAFQIIHGRDVAQQNGVQLVVAAALGGIQPHEEIVQSRVMVVRDVDGV